MLRSIYSIALALCFTMISACERTAPRTQTPPELSRETRAANPTLKERQMAFLARIRESDPDARTIDRAVLNEQNELGLILDRSVEMNKVPALMRTILTRMAKEFPNENLTVIAYAPSQPPRKIGVAHFDSRSRDMTYTPAA